jgi:hypothetical protein
LVDEETSDAVVDAAIEICRPEARRMDRGRKYKVRIDGQDVGSVKARSTDRFPVTSGEHTVSLHYDWVSSPPLHVHLDRGQTLRLEAQPRLEDPVGFDASMRTLRAALFEFKTWIDLRPASPAQTTASSK